MKLYLKVGMPTVGFAVGLVSVLKLQFLTKTEPTAKPTDKTEPQNRPIKPIKTDQKPITKLNLYLVIMLEIY